ncbi:hydantoinase/carbamoylase family amidase [Pseudooceanicola sp. GBMRC 2024]|uniref:Hydantoinase/carbamoylase family amidase n=1 Tax=Pseudooceanicola albus TaxID=2692189 RepID=A0A6L7G2S1_9RHOB|nr:hydantoinase/carbamoylase family amidase [Pseudooceanicola albus]MXN17747.1 hydantoinase/carbamoylase family amidase [Pseudooceanicola albus]
MTTQSTEQVIRETIDRVLTRVNALSEPGPGYTRPSYSDLETLAHAVIRDEAEALGLAVTTDAAGNLLARMEGQDRSAPALHVGSHLDTVGQGGAYDGQAGVAAGLALAAALKAEGQVPPVDLVVIVTRAEESVWFPASYLGSRGHLGRLTRADLEVARADTGRTLADHMTAQGLDPEAALQAAPPRPAHFIEFHIEQGPVLDQAQEPFAIVRGVRGGLRYRNAQIHGTWAHSGGAPRDQRADAVFAFADLVTALDAEWGRRLDAGEDLAVTFGRVDAASPVHAMAKVPGELEFCIDIRSEDDAVLDAMDGVLKDMIAGIETARPGIRFELGAQSRSRPAALSAGLGDWIAEGATARGEAPRRMLSGGGHDAAAFAAAGWDSVMVFIRNWDGSHCPEEGMDPADLARGVAALHAAVLSGAALPEMP